MNDELLKEAVRIICQWNHSRGSDPDDIAFLYRAAEAGVEIPEWFHLDTYTNAGDDDV